ncbi:unnamed protein product [Camellia sinensis]
MVWLPVMNWVLVIKSTALDIIKMENKEVNKKESLRPSIDGLMSKFMEFIRFAIIYSIYKLTFRNSCSTVTIQLDFSLFKTFQLDLESTKKTWNSTVSNANLNRLPFPLIGSIFAVELGTTRYWESYLTRYWNNH